METIDIDTFKEEISKYQNVLIFVGAEVNACNCEYFLQFNIIITFTECSNKHCTCCRSL